MARNTNPGECRSVSLALTGSGGAGVITAGELLLGAAAAQGYYGLMTRSAGPQIRGGEAAALLTLSAGPVVIHKDRYDLLIGVDWLNADRFAAEIPMASEGMVVGDPAGGEAPAFARDSGAGYAEVPLQALAKEIPKGRPNMIALGVAARLIGLDPAGFAEVIARKLEDKGAEVIEAGKQGLAAGGAVADAFDWRCPLAPAERSETPRWIISGNEAIGLGAVRGGVRFAAAYPITPATEVLEWLAPALRRVGGTLVQAEDELASINMIVGASYGGVPALTATSGPGLALMVEAIGLAMASEVPVVVVDVMRGGPSTGIPTKSEQTDLNLAVYGLHGDAPHVVVAPLSLSDCIFTAQWAVHLAEAMQTPAIVLSDQFLGQARAVIDRPADVAFIAGRTVASRPAEGYHRYAITASGVSPMALPGTQGGQYTADGLEHTPRGTPSSRVEDHADQLDKRQAKVTGFDYGNHWAAVEGSGEVAIVTWGSVTGAAREAVERARARGIDVRLVAPRLLAPVRPAEMAAALAGAKRILTVEQSHGGQFHHYLRAFYDLPGDVRAHYRPGPLPITADEIVARLETWS